MTVQTEMAEAITQVAKHVRATPEEIGIVKKPFTKEELAKKFEGYLAKRVLESAGDVNYCNGVHSWSPVKGGHYSAGGFTPYCIRCGEKGDTKLF